MNFVRLEMLLLIWLLPVVLLVIWSGMRRRNRILRNYAEGASLETIRGRANGGARRLKTGLLMAALFFCVLAMAGPRYGYRWQEIEQRGVDIILAVDCSRSMLAQDVSPMRLDRARRKVFDLLTMLEGDRIGLTVFAGVAFLQCPLTLDYDILNMFMRHLSPDVVPVGGTDLAAAIDAAVGAFRMEDDTEKAVILIADGESTVGDPLAAARRARDAGVKIFCMGVGSDQGAPVPDKEGGFVRDRSGRIVMSRLDEEMLKRIAALTGGAYVRAVTGDMDLETIYSRGIRGGMESSVLASGRKQIWEDRYQYVLILAVLALALEMFLRSSRGTVAGVLLLIALGLFPTGEAIARRPDAAQQGVNAYHRGDYQAALDHFIQAQLEDPDRAELYYNIGVAYYKLGDYENARRGFEKALNADKDILNQKTFYNMGNTAFRGGEHENAIDLYERALEIDPEDQLAAANLEFVRNIMEQPPPPPETERGREDDRKEEEDGSSESCGASTGFEKNESNDRPDPGEDGRDESATKQQEDAGREDEELAREDMRQTVARSGGEERSQPDDRELQHAERILDRLQDRPGAAMIPPRYRDREVERDW